jgi:hypothetical protein
LAYLHVVNKVLCFLANETDKQSKDPGKDSDGDYDYEDEDDDDDDNEDDDYGDESS